MKDDEQAVDQLREGLARLQQFPDAPAVLPHVVASAQRRRARRTLAAAGIAAALVLLAAAVAAARTGDGTRPLETVGGQVRTTDADDHSPGSVPAVPGTEGDPTSGTSTPGATDQLPTDVTTTPGLVPNDSSTSLPGVGPEVPPPSGPASTVPAPAEPAQMRVEVIPDATEVGYGQDLGVTVRLTNVGPVPGGYFGGCGVDLTPTLSTDAPTAAAATVPWDGSADGLAPAVAAAGEAGLTDFGLHRRAPFFGGACTAELRFGTLEPGSSVEIRTVWQSISDSPDLAGRTITLRAVDHDGAMGPQTWSAEGSATIRIGPYPDGLPAHDLLLAAASDPRVIGAAAELRDAGNGTVTVLHGYRPEGFELLIDNPHSGHQLAAFVDRATGEVVSIQQWP